MDVCEGWAVIGVAEVCPPRDRLRLTGGGWIEIRLRNHQHQGSFEGLVGPCVQADAKNYGVAGLVSPESIDVRVSLDIAV